MKLIIDIDEYDYSTIVNDERYMPLDISVAIKNGAPIPDNATNGDMIKTIFDPETSLGIRIHCAHFWWNAPYQKGGK